MTRHGKFSSAMVLAGTLTLLCNAKAFHADAAPGDWSEVNHDKLGTRYSPLALINTSNAKNLKKSCEYEFPDKEASQTAPITIGGVVYASTAHSPSRSMGSTVTQSGPISGNLGDASQSIAIAAWH